ncbi:hypothetical protein [Streptomyces decoyicus]|uniref:hypothetical protein n=1 Tax=Streptomyces decoyicus TaxID=249567 RepID=UPI00386C8DB2
MATRFADADLLRELRMPGLLQTELGDDAHAWNAFDREATRLPNHATKTLGALLAEVRNSSTSAPCS